MKTARKNIIRWSLQIATILLVFAALAQKKQTIAVVSIDTRGTQISNEIMADLVRLEMEKNHLFEVLDKYDVMEAVRTSGVEPDNSFGKNRVIQIGQLLQADKMLTGSVEALGDKIIMILRLVDIQSKTVEKSSVMEFLNVQNEIQSMVLVCLNDLFGIKNDQQLIDILIYYNLPITSMKTSVKLTGPRMGINYTMGSTGQRLQDPKSEGGFNMFPVTSMFGYQFEKQYLSSGDFQALVETVVFVNGLESGAIIPSVTFLNGFRFNKSGFELGVGPVLRIVRRSEGYYDDNNNWIIKPGNLNAIPEGVVIEERLDNRGNLGSSLGLVVALGKTFRSGYLNVPVNLFFTPRKDGSSIGLTFGFNANKTPKIN